MAVLNPPLFARRPRMPFPDVEFVPEPQRRDVGILAARTRAQSLSLGGYYNPFWPTTVPADAWMSGDLSQSIPAGITFVDADHPLNNVQFDAIMRVDGNQSHQYAAFKLKNTGGGSLYSRPDTTHRWAMRLSQIIRFRGSQNLPSSQAFLFGSDQSTTVGPNTLGLWLNTNGTLTLKVFNNSGVEADFTSANTVAFDDSWKQYEVWAVLTDARGNTIPTQYLVRTISNLTTTRDVSNWCAGIWGDLGDRLFGATAWIGETTARGAGFEWDVCNCFGAIEDADHPWGVMRGDMMYPDGVGLKQDWDTHASAKVDEMGDAVLANRVPDDAVTIDTVVLNTANRKYYNTYTMTPPGYATSSDTVALVMMGGRTALTGIVVKGNSDAWAIAYDDQGSLVDTGDSGGTGSGASTYKDGVACALLAAANGIWTSTELENMEVGAYATANFSATANLTTIQAVAAFQASGETTPAVPFAPMPVYLMGHNRSAMKFEDYTTTKRQPWVGVLRAPVAVALPVYLMGHNRKNAVVEEPYTKQYPNRTGFLIPTPPTSLPVYLLQRNRPNAVVEDPYARTYPNHVDFLVPTVVTRRRWAQIV